jgi:hypothetical protein
LIVEADYYCCRLFVWSLWQKRLTYNFRASMSFVWSCPIFCFFSYCCQIMFSRQAHVDVFLYASNRDDGSWYWSLFFHIVTSAMLEISVIVSLLSCKVSSAISIICLFLELVCHCYETYFVSIVDRFDCAWEISCILSLLYLLLVVSRFLHFFALGMYWVIEVLT